MKSLFLAAFYLCITIAAAQNLYDGLIVYYPLDGNTRDSSINQFHGITNAEFTEDHNGNPNRALHFNGFDQYFDFPPNRPELKPELPVSFAYWVRFDTILALFGTVFTTDFDQDNHSGTWMSLSSNGGRMGISYGGGNGTTSPENRRTKGGSSALEADLWYYIIGIIRGETDMDIYINCINDEGYYDGSGGPLAYTDCQGNLGRKDGNMYYPPYYIKGSIDDFRYWNRALNEEDLNILCLEIPFSTESRELHGENYLLENPVNDYLLVICSTEVNEVEIMDVNGKVLMKVSPERIINVSQLNSGFYFIQFLDTRGRIISVSKFIKN